MVPQLFSIEQAPRSIPAWELILDDLGRPPADRIAQVLGVSRSTVYRWNQERTGPRIACLALFWLTRWGRSAVYTQATNDAIMAAQLNRSLTEERQQLRHQLAKLDGTAQELARDLAWEVSLRHQALIGRGNAAIAGLTHTGTGHEAASGASTLGLPGQTGPSTAPDLLAWPGLETTPAWPVLPPFEPPPLVHQVEPAGAGERPGTPATPPPEAHSEKCQVPGRTDPPPPSAHQEVSPSSPYGSLCYQSDAILTSSGALSDGHLALFYMGQAPAGGGAPLAPLGPRLLPSALGPDDAARLTPPASAWVETKTLAAGQTRVCVHPLASQEREDATGHQGPGQPLDTKPCGQDCTTASQGLDPPALPTARTAPPPGSFDFSCLAQAVMTTTVATTQHPRTTP